MQSGSFLLQRKNGTISSEERGAFVEVINSINRSRSENEGIHLEPILWEQHAYPEVENPQVIINKLLEEAKLVVVAFWNKFGAPTEKFPSGTMEELFLSINRRKTTGSPSIKIYFRQPLPPKKVEDVNELKRILETKEQIKDIALYKEYSTVEEFRSLLFEHINAWLSDVGNRKNKSKNAKGLATTHRILKEPSDCRNVMATIFRSIENKFDGVKSGICFGIEDIDLAVGELQDSNLTVVGGDMGTGKTSLMIALAKNSAFLNKVPTVIFSPRSSERDIGSSLLCNISQIDENLFKLGLLKVQDWQEIVPAAGRLADAPLSIDDNAQMSIEDIRDQVVRLKAKHAVGLIVIDEINYVTSAQKSIGRQLRILSRELKVPVVVTVSLKTSERRYHIPHLKDLDAVGDLKKEADIIIFMARGEQLHSGIRRCTSEIVIAKNKNGPLISAKLLYTPQYYSFGGNVREDNRIEEEWPSDV